MPTYISTNEIKQGMIIAEPLINNFGQTLLGAGVVLSEKHKMIFKTWNITGVLIKSNDDDEDQAISPELRKKAEERILSKLNWLPKFPVEKDLIEMVIIKIIKMPKIN